MNVFLRLNITSHKNKMVCIHVFYSTKFHIHLHIPTYQYLCEGNNVSDFLPRDSYQRKMASKSTVVV